MRANRSIRFRLTLWYSGVLLAGQCLSGVLIWLLLSHSLHADLDESLQRRTKGLERYLALEASDNLRTFANEMEEFSRSLPADYVMFVEDADGHVLASSSNAGNTLPASLPQLTPTGVFGNANVRGTAYRSYGEIFQDQQHLYRVVLAGSANSIEKTLQLLAWVLLGSIPGVVLAAAAGGFWISNKALAPVDQMTEAARAIDFNNLSARLEVPPDFQEIQRLATTWNAMLQRIESSAIRINRFTADASHELRTPLSLIQATADLALRRPRNLEQYQDALHVIRMETGRMTRLVEDLLFLARNDSGSEPRNRSTFDLRVPMQEASFEIRPKAAAKDVAVKCENPAEALLITGDEDAIRRLILVLLDNAVKFSAMGQQVEIHLRHENGQAVLTVHDAGCGIPPEAKGQIFERFYKADPSRHAEQPSYGLGLAIANAVALQHGCSIDFDSKPGSTVFSVRFPTVEAEHRAPDVLLHRLEAVK